jgi:hypothetical protein
LGRYNFAWTGEVGFGGGDFYVFVAVIVNLDSGTVSWTGVDFAYPVAVCVQ